MEFGRFFKSVQEVLNVILGNEKLMNLEPTRNVSEGYHRPRCNMMP